MNRKYRRKRKGLTLVEIMVVVVILGILVTLIAIRASGLLSQAERTKALADLRTLSDALELHRAAHKKYPSNEEGLQVLTQPTEEHPEGLLPAVPLDPWGNAYVYLYPGRHGTYDILTLGSDGTEGGTKDQADIGNWELYEQ